MDFQRLLASVKKHEGYRAKVYKDSLGYDTIGYGTCVKDMNLSESTASLLCEQELFRITIVAYQRFKWLITCPAVVQEVVIELCYQIGVTGFSKFKKTIEHLEEGRWVEAADEGLRSKWARQDSPSRANELMNRIRSLG